MSNMGFRRSVIIVSLACSFFGSTVLSVAQIGSSGITAEHQPGIEMFRQRNFEAAVTHFESLLKKNKNDEISLYYLGLSLERQDKLKEAKKRFENAIKLKPDFARAYSALSYTEVRRNKNADALKYAEHALRIESDLPDAHYVVGLVQLRSRMPREALRSSEEAIKLAPEMAPAHLLRSSALLSLYTQEVTDRSRRSSFRFNPQTATAEELERRQQRRKERGTAFAEAANSLETYLRLQPNDPSSKMWRDQLDTLRVYATEANQEKQSGSVEEQLWSIDEVTTRPRILEKPEPTYTEEARTRGVVGTVVLRAVFAADGTVRHILVLSGLPEGLTERAVDVARRIKFVPGTINGAPVSIAVQLEYNFNVY